MAAVFRQSFHGELSEHPASVGFLGIYLKIIEGKMNTQQLIDKLGQIKSKISFLESEAGKIKSQLIEAGITAAEGELYSVNIVTSTRETVDWKSISSRLGPTRQLIAAHTRKSEVVSVYCHEKPVSFVSEE